jgi:hypothetical protein
MALIAAQQHKILTASSGGTLRPPAGHAYRVRNIHCLPSSNDTLLTVTLGSLFLMHLRAKGKAGNHVPFPAVYTTAAYEQTPGTVFDLARRIGAPMDIPLCSDEILSVARYAEAGYVVLSYDDFTADDVHADEVNGSASGTRRYVHYVGNTAQVTATPVTGWTSLLPTGTDPWPIGGADVGENRTFRLLAALGCPCAVGSTSNKGYTGYLQLLLNGDMLFDEDRNGIPFVGDVSNVSTLAYKAISSMIGAMTAENPQPPLVFVPPIVAVKGDILTVVLTVPGATTGGIAAAGIDLAFLTEFTKAA